MDWEANLAAIIRCTDASLEQQFRQFEDVTAEFSADEAHAGVHDPSGNVAATYLRDSMAAEYRHRQDQHLEQEQPRKTPSYARVSDAFARAPAAATATTFSEHFHRRKRGAATGRAKDNQRPHHRDSEYGLVDEEAHVQEVDEPRYAAPRPAGQGAYHQQMYTSPTYDMAQMMEQVRLSLKLEVDARAAIAERQLSALLQLCKATSEELDRLRVEVCANDRQLHTLDQVQSKIRQELTTQKDIGFHLQSMCGKDESWRMQIENQMLELRQMVAALREQGNSTQAVAQEKLSRSELLVQFNAAMEPIKAQLQANLQHQAQQIAEVTRTTSSSSLLLDGITQKVNRGVTDEINELRSDLSALKHHVAKMDIFQDGSRGFHQDQQGRSPGLSKEEQENKAKEKQQQQETKIKELREGLVKELTTLAKDYVDAQTMPIRLMIDENSSRFITKRELETLQSVLEDSCRNRMSSAMIQIDSQLKSSQEQVRGECKTAVRDTSDRLDRSTQQTANTMTIALEVQSNASQSKQLELLKMFEREQKDRKQALDELQEALRKSRHQLEDQIHSLTHESRTQLAERDSEVEKRVKQVEKQVEITVAELQKETQTTMAALKSEIQVQGHSNGKDLNQKLKRLEETVAATNLTVTALSKSVASSVVTSSSTTCSDSSAKDVSLALEKQTNVYVSTMETLMQKMQLQLQLQAQSQVQMAMTPSPYHGYWPSSPYAASQPPPPPTLHLPPAVNCSIATNAAEQFPMTSVNATAAKCASPPSPALSSLSSAVKAGVDAGTGNSDKAADRLCNAVPVNEVDRHPPQAPSNVSLLSPNLTPEVEASHDQSSPQRTDNRQSSDSADPSSKRHHTLATTAKGALAEAELAKARVETRRKQELEVKQQRQVPVSVAPTNDDKSSVITANNGADPMEPGSRRSSVPVMHSGYTPVSAVNTSKLTHSTSSSALPGKDVTLCEATSAKALASTSTPNNAAAASTSPSSPASPPQLTTTRGGSVTQQDVVKRPVQSPALVPSVVSLPVSKVDSILTPAAQTTPNDSLLTSTRSNGPPPQPQKEPQALTLPVSKLPTSPPTKEELPPPPSPLAKLFTRHSETAAVVTTLADVNSTAALRGSMNDNILAPGTPKEADAAQALPTASLATSILREETNSPPVSHVLCGLSRLPIRSDVKSEHEKSQCPKRMVQCIACKQQVQWVDLEMHELECIKALRNTNEAVDAASSSNEVKTPPEANSTAENEGSLKKCRHCSTDVPSLDLLEHEINCDKVLKQCPHCLRRQKMSELQDHIENCDCRLVSCPNDCGGKFLQRGIPNHLATRCPKKPLTASIPGSAAPPRTAYPANKPASAPSITPPLATPTTTGNVQCKFCDDEFEASNIDDHEQNCDWKPKRCQHCNMVVISRDLMRHEASCKTNLKACPHCNENMPQSALTTHASRCSKRPIKCIRCCQLFPADAIVAHSTNCKFVPGSNPASANPASPQQIQNAVWSQQATSRTPIKIPPPPPFPPPPTATTPVPVAQLNTRRASADPRMGAIPSADPFKTATPAQETASDRLARRNLALSQLTNSGAPVMGGPSTQHERSSAARASAPSLHPPTISGLQTRLIIQPDGRDHVDEDEEDEDDGEYDDDDDDELTLAQVVKEWSVENVCLWLHEDVGVPEVVIRFQQKQCSGEMLLELTESDLINDFGVKDRIHRERILNAIEAIQTSDAYSDEDEEDEDEEDASEEDEDEQDESEDYSINDAAVSPTTRMRHSIGGATYTHPRDILRRKSQPSPQIILGNELPSSNDMLRRISSALENPKR